jgi:hypothetical protein
MPVKFWQMIISVLFFLSHLITSVSIYHQNSKKLTNSNFLLIGQKGSFKENQLDQIRQASMARLICDNTNIDIIQPMAFRLADNKM